MPRIRTVKPELFRHEALFEAERIYGFPLRLAFIGLFLCSDREGRFRWRPKQLKLDIFPYDDLDMENVLNTLVKSGFVLKYTYQTETYGCIPSWKKHQKINSRELESIIPEFEKNNIFAKESEKNLENQLDTNVIGATNTFVSLNREEINTKENTTSLVLNFVPANKDVTTVFEHWKKIMGCLNAQLDSKRTASIQNALQIGYTITQLFEAIEGCRNTPHNMGKNEQGERYDGLHIIFRDADQIDRFIHNFHQPPRQLNNAEKRTQSNVQAMQNWLNKKMNQGREEI